jgi:hypothetical protein
LANAKIPASSIANSPFSGAASFDPRHFGVRRQLLVRLRAPQAVKPRGTVSSSTSRRIVSRLSQVPRLRALAQPQCRALTRVQPPPQAPQVSRPEKRQWGRRASSDRTPRSPTMACRVVDWLSFTLDHNSSLTMRRGGVSSTIHSPSGFGRACRGWRLPEAASLND